MLPIILCCDAVFGWVVVLRDYCKTSDWTSVETYNEFKFSPSYGVIDFNSEIGITAAVFYIG